MSRRTAMKPSLSMPAGGDQPLCPKCLHRLFCCLMDFANAVEPDKLKHCFHRPGNLANPKVPSGCRQLFQTGKNDAATAAINKLNAVKIEHHFRILFEDRRHIAFEVIGYA